MVAAYWEIGRVIVEQEQEGQQRAEYGRALITELSSRLKSELFGKGFDPSNLAKMRIGKGGQARLFRGHCFPVTFLGRCGARSVDSSPSCSAVRRTQFSPPYGWPRATQRRIASTSASVCGSLTSLHQPFG